MRIASIFASFCLCGSLVPTVSFAQSAPAKPDFSSQSRLIGSWSCKTVKDPDPKYIGTTYAMAIGPDPAKYWFVATTKWGKRYLTRDPKTKQWIETYVGNQGGYNLGTSPGWKGNVIVFKDVVNAGDEPLGTEKLTLTSDRTIDMYYSDSTKSGSISDDICSKT